MRPGLGVEESGSGIKVSRGVGAVFTWRGVMSGEVR